MLFSSVGVIGCGSHSRELVALLAQSGFDVRVLPWSRRDGAVDLWPAAEGRIEVQREPASLYGCDLVYHHRVPDGPESQREALKTIEPCLSEGAILAVDTSLASLDWFLPALHRPTQAVGLVFPRLLGAAPGVEVNVTDHTAPGVVLAVRQFCAALGRWPLEAVADAAE